MCSSWSRVLESECLEMTYSSIGISSCGMEVWNGPSKEMNRYYFQNKSQIAITFKVGLYTGTASWLICNHTGYKGQGKSKSNWPGSHVIGSHLPLS